MSLLASPRDAEIRTARHPATRTSRSYLLGLSTFAIFAAVAILIYLPAGPLSTTRIPGGGFDDPPQLAFFLAWVPYAFEHGLNPFFTNYVNFPGGINLATNTTVPLLGVIAAPITLTLGPIAAVNLLLHLAFVLSAGSMYVVLRSWTRRWTAAFAGGLLYGFSPYMITQARVNAHLDLLFVPLLPVLVWSAYELVVVGRRRPGRLGSLLGIVSAAQILIDPELLSELVLLLGIALIVLMLVRRGAVRERARGVATGIAVASATFLVLGSGVYIWGAFFATDHLSGPVQLATYLQWYRADLLGPILPTSNQLLAPAALAVRANQFDHGDLSENAAYLGLPLLIVLGAIVVVLRRNAAVRTAGGLAVLAFVFTLGTPLTIDNRSTGIPLLGSVTSRLPILDNFLPARFAVFVTLFGAVVLAVGIDHALDAARRARRPALRLGELGAAGAVSLLALLPSVPLATAVPPWPASLPNTLKAIPAGSVVLSYPYPITPWSGPMLWQAEDGIRFRIIGGYAVFRTPAGVGNTGPPLLAPSDVEEFLLASQEGAASYFPQPSAKNPDREEDLCIFLRRYSVHAVVYWATGNDPLAVRAYFSLALGKPSVDTDGVLLWLNPERTCRS